MLERMHRHAAPRARRLLTWTPVPGVRHTDMALHFISLHYPLPQALCTNQAYEGKYKIIVPGLRLVRPPLELSLRRRVLLIEPRLLWTALPALR